MGTMTTAPVLPSKLRSSLFEQNNSFFSNGRKPMKKNLSVAPVRFFFLAIFFSFLFFHFRSFEGVSFSWIKLILIGSGGKTAWAGYC